MEPYSNNLPNVIINELEIHTANNELYAASYGRGLWVSPTADPSLILGTAANSFAESVQLFPNPANTKITIVTPTGSTGDVRVYDTSGKLVIYKKDKTLNTSETMDVSTLQSGMYYVRINTENGTATKKMLKQ